jgi:ribosomal protein L37AE/L43A
MADTPSCPHCRETRLFHTGALWMCPRCSLMITKQALAADLAAHGPRACTVTEESCTQRNSARN